MAQLKHDIFKEHLQKWMLENADTYDAFEKSQTKRFYKSLISKTIKFLIKKSEKLGLRTEQDWIDYRNLQAAIKDDAVLDWALSEDTARSKNADPKTLQKKNNDISLDEMILLADEEKRILLLKIKEYLNNGAIGKRIALMILALQQLDIYPRQLQIVSFLQP